MRRSSEAGRAGALLLVLGCAACEADAPPAGTAPRPSAAARPVDPQTSPTWDTLALEYGRDVLPERPDAPLVLPGLCPGECCGFGDWMTSDHTALFPVPVDTLAPADTLPPRTPLHAVSGHVLLTRVGLATVAADTDLYAGIGEPLRVPAGDSVWLLGYQGEGFYVGWHGGSLGEISVEDGGRIHREPEGETWARVRVDGAGAGWVRMDRSPLLWGVDRCGGPGPPLDGATPCSDSWLAHVDSTFRITDADGHGPDLGSDEWLRVLARRTGMEARLDSMEALEWCADLDRTLWGPFPG